MTKRRRAVVAMSGGVDSSVAAALLVERGYDVTGIMLKLWKGEAENNASGCCNLGAAEDARRVADALDIPFYVLNFAERFEASVIANFHEDYAAGRTPNPCVRCNQWIKFDALLERADALGADFLATGHYARVTHDGDRYRLRRGVDPRKDQSYVLWMLTQQQLARCLFPVGEMEKPETRRLAAELGLRTAAKPDSQEICFVRNGDVGAYMASNVPAASVSGPILDADGDTIGTHRGIGNYTIGQRKGLGISLGVPVFVTGIDAEDRSITVGSRRDLEVDAFESHETSWTATAPAPGTEVLVQHRAHGETSPGVIERVADDRCRVVLEEPVEAMAPGQSAAFYDAGRPDELIGGGVILDTDRAGAVV
ncbi:MAG: tRNA-uridine 2-sulfurtransferase [Actinomycetota bacterium]|nr:tRNA-uridine 2-sulfurtransferase [Actinomycetota bacterium]